MIQIIIVVPGEALRLLSCILTIGYHIPHYKFKIYYIEKLDDSLRHNMYNIPHGYGKERDLN